MKQIQGCLKLSHYATLLALMVCLSSSALAQQAEGEVVLSIYSRSLRQILVGRKTSNGVIVVDKCSTVEVDPRTQPSLEALIKACPEDQQIAFYGDENTLAAIQEKFSKHVQQIYLREQKEEFDRRDDLRDPRIENAEMIVMGMTISGGAAVWGAHSASKDWFEKKKRVKATGKGAVMVAGAFAFLYLLDVVFNGTGWVAPEFRPVAIEDQMNTKLQELFKNGEITALPSQDYKVDQKTFDAITEALRLAIVGVTHPAWEG